MASEGPLSPGTVCSEETVNSDDWVNETNAKASDNAYVTCTNSGFGVSDRLLTFNFGFSIPAGATVVGIVVEIERSEAGATGDGTVRDLVLRPCKNATGTDGDMDGAATLVGDNKAATGTDWPSSDAYASYGSASDLWGTTWAAAEINASGFGVAFSQQSAGAAPEVARVDHIRITVYYTTSAQTIAAGLTTETDTAQALTEQKRKAAGLNTETDLAQAHTSAKRSLVGHSAAAQFTRANNEYLSIVSNPAINVGGDTAFAAGVWVWLDTDANTLQEFMGEYNVGGARKQFLIRATANRFSFVVSSNGSTEVVAVADNFGAPPTGQWCFVVVEHDPVADTISIRVNDGTPNSTAHSTGIFNGTPSPFRLGTRGSNVPLNFLDGRLDSVGIWKRTLTTAEKTWLYNSRKGRNYADIGSGDGADLATNLQAWWDLEEVSGTRLDSHSTNHLTDNNTVTGAVGIQAERPVIETETAFSMTAQKARVIAMGLSSEADEAFAMTHAKRLALAQALETDTVLVVSAGRIRAVSLTMETDLALGLTHAKRASIGLVTEADLAVGLAIARRYGLGQAEEADLALALAVAFRRRINVGLVVETDEARPVRMDKFRFAEGQVKSPFQSPHIPNKRARGPGWASGFPRSRR